MMSCKDVFLTDLDFCPQCGTVMPLPGNVVKMVKCVSCNYKVNIEDFHGIVVKSKVIFNKVTAAADTGEDTQTEITGPTAERKCPKCGNDTMIYTTRQTRSADEGQTVFFTCPECRFQDIEYS